ncbi:MAG: GNAT family N-acetyltransferase [Halobacteriota archaeon]
MEPIRVTNFEDSHVDDLHQLYRNEWWSDTRERDELPGMLAESDEVVAFEAPNSGELVAFTRILTDYTYKAVLFDVIIAESYRGEGLGRRLIEEAIGHPRLADVEDFELYCVEEMVEFYEKWDFTDELGDVRLMRR